MLSYLPDFFQIIHNTGIYNYKIIPLLFFTFKVFFLVISPVIIVVIFLFLLWKRRIILKKIKLSFYAVIVIVLLFNSFIFTDTISKIYFAKGYKYFLSHEDLNAQIAYFRSLDFDPYFIPAFNHLVDLYRQSSVNTDFLDELALRSEKINETDVLNTTAHLYEEKQNYSSALKYYQFADNINASISNNLNIIRILTKLNDFEKAAVQLIDLEKEELENNHLEHYLYIKSQIALNSSNFRLSRLLLDSLLLEPKIKPEYYILNAKALIQLGELDLAISKLNMAIYLKKELPEAYFEKAKIFYKQKKLVKAKEELIKTLYYDNQNSLAYVMMQIIKNKKWKPVESVIYIKDMALETEYNNELIMIKGDTTNIKVKIKNTNANVMNNVGLIEPYGFGIECEITPSLVDMNYLRSGDNINLQIVAKRSSKVNNGKSWPLNLVFYNIEKGVYTDFSILVGVNDPPEEEGRILFVITEDNEQNSDNFHSDDTPHIQDLDPYELRIDLIDKLIFADELADKYGIKWSHIIDIGSTHLRLQWLQNLNISKEWDNIWADRKSAIKKALESGHDIQLHIHAYNIPDNYLFIQYFNPSVNRIEFTENKDNHINSPRRGGAWASNFKNQGDYYITDSRIGSLFRGINLLENDYQENIANYRTIFFRAGEYDFGEKNEMSKSILALRKNKILANSDAFSGTRFHRSFKFFRRVGNNVYFSKFDNIREESKSFLDIGILEIVPVPKKNGHDYIMPIDDWQHIKYNYDQCFTGDKVKNDIFILMEMFHLNNINWRDKWDALDDNFGEWLKMNNHFKNIKTNLPKMEFVTISEAIKIYLDIYTPDIVALRTNERKISDKVFLYNLDFYGKDIEVNEENPHFVSIKPPAYFVKKMNRIELLQKGMVIHSWNDINYYNDLDFQITDSQGYEIKVYLN